MKNNYMNFEVFNRYQELVEQHNLPEKLGQFDAINEAFDSSILRNLAAQESGRTWRGSFAKDFYKHAGIKIDKITNEDFIQISPEEWWTQGYSKNNSAIGFFVDDNPELFKAWDSSLQKRMDREGKTLKLNKILKNAQGVGLILTIMRGKVGMWTGFLTDPGLGRRKKSSDDRYGVLADQWRTDSKYRYDGVPSPDAKITKKNLLEVATKVYVLDIDALRSKYSNSELQTARIEAKRGAAAFITPAEVKKANNSRYEEALQNKTTPEALWGDVTAALNKYITWFTEKIGNITPDSAKDITNTKVNFGNWGHSSLIDPINQMLRTVEEMARDYDYAMQDIAHSEKLASEIETEKDEQKKLSIQSEIEYYSNALVKYNKKALTYRKQILQYVNDVNSIIK